MRPAEQWPASASEAFAWLATGRTILPRDMKGARKVLSLLQALRCAACLNRQAEFEQERMLPGFEAAFGNWGVSLWKWVYGLTPPGVLGRLDQAQFTLPNTPHTKASVLLFQSDYLLWRALFVGGMKVGEGFRAEHYRHFAYYALAADKMQDAELFEIAKQHVCGSKRKDFSVQHRRVRYRLLVAWLPCGLWHKTRAGQANALLVLDREIATRDKEKEWKGCSEETVAQAEKELGLRRIAPE